jgi:hypothetical protein
MSYSLFLKNGVTIATPAPSNIAIQIPPFNFSFGTRLQRIVVAFGGFLSNYYIKKPRP